MLRLEPLEERCLFAVLDLNGLGLDGFTMHGADANDQSGISVSLAGDVNGDGFDDLIIGARYADAANNAKTSAGESYLVFGKPDWSDTETIDLANLGTAGVVFFGVDAYDYSGRAVSTAGDVNGDGFDDLLIGAVGGDAANNSEIRAGESYLIFGKADWSSTPTINLATLDLAGVRFLGAEPFDNSGRSVATAGDVNGDGFDDLLIGAPVGDGANNLKPGAGETVLIFGKPDWSATPTIDLANLGPIGVTLFGADAYDNSATSVNTAGDINGDGFDDLLIGAQYGNAGNNAKISAGEAYIVFGKADWSTTLTLDLANLGTSGVRIFGAETNDYAGLSLRGAGDVNGDGFDDVLIGAVGGDGPINSRLDAGDSYLIFGKANWTTTPVIDLANLGAAGVIFSGGESLDRSGLGVSAAGDMNGDGFDDLVIGARFADALNNSKTSAGESYVVFGKPDWSDTPTVNLATLGTKGITIRGARAYDYSGFALSLAGDVNGDGFDDLIIGAPFADGPQNLRVDAGGSYVVFGGDEYTFSATHLGSAANDSLQGTAAANIMIGGLGDDLLRGAGGADVLRGGHGNDILAVSDLNFRRVVGGRGRDTLRLDAGGVTLDLTQIPDNRIVGIEQINMTGSGVNTLVLNAPEVLNLSNESNTLVVLRDGSDVVQRGTGWTQQANEVLDGSTFLVFTQGAATLKLQVAFADVAVTKTASVSSVFAGGTFFYTVTVSNSGPSHATSVVMTDTLPPQLTFHAGNSSNGCSASGQVVTCNFGTITSGSSKLAQISVRVSSAVPHDTVVDNTASITLSETDPTPGDHSDTVSVTVNRQSDVRLTKSAPLVPVLAGNTFAYLLQVTNNGPSDASGVTITDTLPDGLNFVASLSSNACAALGQEVTCNLGVVPSGASPTLQLGVGVNASLAHGAALTNTAEVTILEADPTLGDHTSTATVTVHRQADLQIQKTASVNPVLAGGSFTYHIQLKNAGPSDASSVTIVDLLPTGLTFDAANSSSQCTAINQEITCPIGDVAKGAELSYLFAVMVDSSLPRGAKLSNEASVSATEVDPDSSNQSDQVVVTVNVSPDPFPWQNVVNRFDVNNDTFVVPFDVLLVVNELNSPRFSNAQRMLPVPPPPGVIPFLDVTGDNFVVPNDALNIINFLNSLAGEGESAGGLGTAGVPSSMLIWPGAAATPAIRQGASIESRPVDAADTLGADRLWATLASLDSAPSKAADQVAIVSAGWTELEQSLDELAEDVAAWWWEIL